LSAHHDHHAHGHHHGPADHDRAFAIGIGLNMAYVVAETGAGLWTGSVALLADAGHNLSDVLGLAVAWGGAALARRPASGRYTYGWKGSTILAALLNAVLLMVALGAIIWEGARRLAEPAPVMGGVVAGVAAVGILVNGATALLFARGRHGDVNVRGAFLHMAADAAVSAGVVVAGLVIWRTGALWIDPLSSLVIAALILWRTGGLLRETVEMALHAVPRGIDPEAVRAALMAMKGVAGVHDLHIWPISTTEPVLTAHLLMPGGSPGDGFLEEARGVLRDRFGIGHATLEVTVGQVEASALLSNHPASGIDR
jgi:cobalt-zinc-cadmium efflux system protein